LAECRSPKPVVPGSSPGCPASRNARYPAGSGGRWRWRAGRPGTNRVPSSINAESAGSVCQAIQTSAARTRNRLDASWETAGNRRRVLPHPSAPGGASGVAMGFGLQPAVRGADVLQVCRFVECGSRYDPQHVGCDDEVVPRFSNSMRDEGMKQAVLQRVDQLHAALAPWQAGRFLNFTERRGNTDRM
jgi:hypothetical protein